MDAQLLITLQNYGFSDKEARIYLTCLELGSSLASTIARRAEVNRWTAYSILQDFKRQGIASETIIDEVKYFSVVSPEVLFKKEEEKYEKMKSTLPELLAITEKFGNRPKTQFFEWLEGLKYVYKQVILSWEEMNKWESFLTFVWSSNIDSKLQKYLIEEFVPWRLKYKTPTKAIIDKKSLSEWYSKYNKDKHNNIIIDDPIFDIANEIIVHWKDKISILMYAPNEMCALTITSQTLHNWLKSMFNLIWKLYKKKHRW